MVLITSQHTTNKEELLANSVNKFGIVRLKGEPYFQEDTFIGQTTSHRVYTLQVDNQVAHFFSFETGDVITVYRHDIESYFEDKDWRDSKEEFVMRKFSEMYVQRLSISDCRKVVNDVMDLINDRFIHDLFPMNEFDVFVGDYSEDEVHRAFKVSISVPYKILDFKEEYEFFAPHCFDGYKFTNHQVAMELLNVEENPHVQQIKKVLNLQNLRDQFYVCDPHTKAFHENLEIEFEENFKALFLKCSIYFKFSRCFSSKGGSKRLLERVATELRYFAERFKDNYEYIEEIYY